MAFQHDKTKKRGGFYTLKIRSRQISLRVCVCVRSAAHTHTNYKYRYFYKLRVFTLPIKNRFDRDHYCHCVFVCVRMNVMNSFCHFYMSEIERRRKEMKKNKAASQEQVSSYVWMLSEAIQKKKIGLKHNKAKWINLMGWNLFENCGDDIGLCSIRSDNFFIVHTFLLLHISLS